MKTSISNWLLVGFTATIVVSCVSATKYGVTNSYYGNSITEDSEVKGLYLSTFKGNESTYTWDSTDYAELAALEFCAKKSQYTILSQPVDESVSSTQVSAYSNSYTINNTTYTNYNVVPITKTYPKHTIVFQCRSKLFTLEGIKKTETISREMVHAITKDFKAGVLLKDIDLRIKDGALQADDIVIKVNNVRIESLSAIMDTLDKADKKSVPVTIIRESKIQTVNAKVLDRTHVIKEFDQNIVKPICAPKKPAHASLGGPSMAAAGRQNTESQDTSVNYFKLACATVTDFLNRN